MTEPVSNSPALTRKYLKYALAVIFFANFLSYLDRQIIGGGH